MRVSPLARRHYRRAVTEAAAGINQGLPGLAFASALLAQVQSMESHWGASASVVIIPSGSSLLPILLTHSAHTVLTSQLEDD